MYYIIVHFQNFNKFFLRKKKDFEISLLFHNDNNSKNRKNG